MLLSEVMANDIMDAIRGKEDRGAVRYLLSPPEDSILLMIASSASITAGISRVSQRLSASAHFSLGNLLEEDVKINEATVKAVCGSPPVAAHIMPTRLEPSQGIVPKMAMRVVFHPSTNSSACRLSLRRSRKTQWIQSCVLESRSGLRYAYIISWSTKSSKGTTVGRVVGVY